MSKFDSKSFLVDVPHQPGVYRMYDGKGKIIYVGKAKDLKKRLSSYFRANLPNRKTEALVSNIAHIETTLTHSETEALLLEHNYIKENQPKYNVLLRDDKAYPYILLTKHQHPRVGSFRGSKKISGEYFDLTLMPRQCGKRSTCCKKFSLSDSVKTAIIKTAPALVYNIRSDVVLPLVWKVIARKKNTIIK